MPYKEPYAADDQNARRLRLPDAGSQSRPAPGWLLETSAELKEVLPEDWCPSLMLWEPVIWAYPRRVLFVAARFRSVLTPIPPSNQSNLPLHAWAQGLAAAPLGSPQDSA